MEENKIITLEALPVIKYHLENLSIEIKKKVDNATNLVCNEDTIQEVKKTRAELNKEFNELENERKQVKNAIMEKYNEFNQIYEENVSILYKQADASLKEKINNVENELKQEKENELRDFFNQHCEANNINFIAFENVNLNITLSASIKSLKQQILDFIEKISNDLKLIEIEEYKDEILVDYTQTLDFTKSKLNIVERHKSLEQLAKAREQLEEIKRQDEKIEDIVDKVIEITTPKEIINDEDIIKVQFTIETTKSNIIKLKEFLKENNINYE